MTSWSDLAYDALEHITGLLTMPDQHRFSTVCQSWRLVAKHKRRPAQELPWLVLGEDQITKRRNFFSLSEQRHYSIDIPELYGQYICGSSYGWLFTVDIRINGRLLNPFTRECYELPPFPPFRETRVLPIEEEEVYNSNGVRIVNSFRVMQKKLVVKAILSHDPKERSDFTAMIMFGYPHKLALWRPGDVDWTVIKRGSICVSDVICFEGKFYVVSTADVVFAVQLGPNPEMKIIARKTPAFDIYGNWKYLVNFKGQLLLIRRVKENFDEPTSEMDVTILNLREGTCHELDAIDDLAIFVGNNSAVVVDPNKFPSCIRNGIYFTDMSACFFWQDRPHDFGVYDVVNKSFGQFCPSDDVICSHYAAITWFTPSP